MATLDTTCPTCGAPHARKLSVIYQEGRSHVETTIQTVGKTNTIAQVKVRTQGTSTGVQQTAASMLAAPPAVPELFPRAKRVQRLIFAGTVAALVFVVAYGAESGWTFVEALMGAAVVGFVGLCFGVMRGSQPTQEEITKHRKRHKDVFAALERWENTFACTSCGYLFVPDGVAKAVAA